ncbi:MAG: RNA 2',3'-cyclic phosphodiesterase [Deltaproteobacteria bacterium]|nr:RNA 2',3'-cyclic phosphodiesterase [Deltaproteobacteria bacterium]
MDSRRLFLAVPVSDRIRSAILNHLRDHCGRKPLPGRVARPESWHFTLKFLGNVLEAQYDSLLSATNSLGLGKEFELTFDGLGAFPRPSKASVLWIGVEKGAEELCRLAALVEDAATSTGFPADNRPFHPHLTLSRIRPPEPVDSLLSGVAPLKITMVVSEIVLYQSHLGKEGARYQVLDRFALKT